jgi:hypothetical protein
MAIGTVQLAKAQEIIVKTYYQFRGERVPEDPSKDKKFIDAFYDNASRAMPAFKVGVDPDASLWGMINIFVDNASDKFPIDLSKVDDWFRLACKQLAELGYVKLERESRGDIEERAERGTGYEIYKEIQDLPIDERRKIDEDHPTFNHLMRLDDPYYLVLHIINNLGKRLDEIFDAEEAKSIFERLYNLHPDFAVRYAERIIKPDVVKDIIDKDYFAFDKLRKIINEEHFDQARKYVEYYKVVRLQHKDKDPDKEILNRFLNSMDIEGIEDLSAESIYRLGPVAFARLAVFLAPGVLAPEDAIEVRKTLGEIVDKIEEKINDDKKLSEAEEFVLNVLTSLNIVDDNRKPNLFKKRMSKEQLESMFKKIIDESPNVDEALNRMNEQYKKYADKIKEFDVDVAKIFYEIPAGKFKADWLIVPALSNHPILDIAEFVEVAKKAIAKKENQAYIYDRLHQIAREKGFNEKMLIDKFNEAYGLQTSSEQMEKRRDMLILEFSKIIRESSSVEDVLNNMHQYFLQFGKQIKQLGINVLNLMMEPIKKFGVDLIIIPAFKNHQILNIPEFKEAIRRAMEGNIRYRVLERLDQIAKKEGGNFKMMIDKLNNAYGINLSASAKLNLSDAIIKAATIIKNHKNLPSSIIEQIESQFLAMDDDFKSAYAAVALDVGHKPIDDLIPSTLAKVRLGLPARTRRLASMILSLAIDAGAANLARHAAKWVDPSELEEEEGMYRIPEPPGDPFESLIRRWSNRLIPLLELEDVQYFVDAATLKIFKHEGDEPGMKPVVNRMEINQILKQVDMSKINQIASAIHGVDLRLDRAPGFYNLVPLIKYSMPSDPTLEKRIMFSPSDGQFYAFHVDKRTGNIVGELPPSMILSTYDIDLISSHPEIKRQVVEKIKRAALEHYSRYKHESKLVVEDEPTLVYADNKNIIYYLKGSLYRFDLSNLSFVRLSKGEFAEFKEYLYDIKPVEYEKHFHRGEAYNLIDSVQISGLKVSKFDIYIDPYTKRMKAKYFNSDLDAPRQLQNAIISRYLNLPELSKGNIFEIKGKRYIVTYDSKLKKYFIRDYDTRKYVSPEDYEKILMHVAYKTREYKLPDGRTFIIAYNPLNNSYLVFDKETGEEIKNMNIVKKYFEDLHKKEVFFDNKKYIIYFDPIENRYVVTDEFEQEVQSEKFKNKILEESATGKHTANLFYIGKIRFAENKIWDVYYHPLVGEFFIEKDNKLVKPDYTDYNIILKYIKEKNISLPEMPVEVGYHERRRKFKLDIREKIEENVKRILESVDASKINKAFDYIIEQVVLSKSVRNAIRDGVLNIFRKEKKLIDEAKIKEIIEFLKEKLELDKIELDYLGNLLTLELIHRNAYKIEEIYQSFASLVGHETDIGEDIKAEMKNLNDYINKLYTSFLKIIAPEKRSNYDRTFTKLMPHFSGFREISKQIWKTLAAAFLVKILKEKAYSFVSSVNFEQEIENRVKKIVEDLIGKKVLEWGK